MMTKHGEFIEYCELLNRLNKSKPPHHLLLGNGFNISLGVSTDYKKIYEEMKKLFNEYERIERLFDKNKYDLEEVIKHLQNTLQPKKNNLNEEDFLKYLINNRIKLDFMQALFNIVEPKVADIYTRKEENIRDFFKLFRTYSTLNFDPFLYLLLLRLKKPDDDNQSTPEETAEKNSETLSTVDTREEHLLKLVRAVYDEDGILALTMKGTENFDIAEFNVKEIKPVFLKYCINKFKDLDGINEHELEQAIDKFLSQRSVTTEDNKQNVITKPAQNITNTAIKDEEKNAKYYPEFNDGFHPIGTQLVYDTNNQNQNIYFLHGGLHLIYKKKVEQVVKVKKNNKTSFINHIEQTIRNQSRHIICILSGTSKSKTDEIDDNPYLRECYRNFQNLAGEIVILGCSLDKSDEHIFKVINSKKIKKVYIATSKKELPIISRKVEQIIPIPDEKITYFNYAKLPFSEKVLDF